VSEGTYGHITVLRDEVVDAITGHGFRLVVDGTLGLGGHSEALLARDAALRVWGLEWDATALDKARQRLAPFGNRFESSAASYADLREQMKERGIEKVDGLVLDLGLSSLQLSDTARGFSFLSEGPLDMRMSDSLPETAWQLLHRLNEFDLMRLFSDLGEERFARRAAQAVKRGLAEGTLTNNAKSLADLLQSSLPYRDRHIHPATRCFQALRIAVNGELDNVQKILGDLPSVVRSGGRVAIIAFHSLEDRLVKRAFQHAARGCVCPPAFPACVCGQKPWGKILTKKPIRASEAEVQQNPRSRSACLRVLELV